MVYLSLLSVSILIRRSAIAMGILKVFFPEPKESHQFPFHYGSGVNHYSNRCCMFPVQELRLFKYIDCLQYFVVHLDMLRINNITQKNDFMQFFKSEII